MKLLICTQKVDKNDSVLGFFHRWVEEFSKHCETVTVICLEKGEYSLLNNVKVLSLGKEHGVSRLRYLFCFYTYIWKYRKEYDKVFVHMNPEYVVLGGLFWRLLKKKISLWYVHRQVNFKLRIAEKLCSKIFSVSPESFRVKSKKVSFVGHGIDTKKFKCGSEKLVKDKFQIISVGRITRIKNLDVLIKAVALLPDQVKKNVCVKLVGAPVTADDNEYKTEIEKIILERRLGSVVSFVGSISQEKIVRLYCESSLSVNLAPTGGMDKAVLESMSCGVKTLFANDAFLSVVENYRDQLQFRLGDEDDLKDKIVDMFNLDQSGHKEMSGLLQGQVVNNYGIEKLINKILITQ